jgi:ATP-dependent DNA ligase
LHGSAQEVWVGPCIAFLVLFFVAINLEGKLSVVSRKRRSLSRQYPYIDDALGDLPGNTVVDGEIVALHDSGRPNFNLLQHSRSQVCTHLLFRF